MNSNFSKTIQYSRKTKYISKTGQTSPKQPSGFFITDLKQLSQKLSIIQNSANTQSRFSRKRRQNNTVNLSIKIKPVTSSEKSSPKPARKLTCFQETVKLGPGSYQVSPTSSPPGGYFDQAPRFPQDHIQTLKYRLKHRRILSYQDKILAKKIFHRNKELHIHKPVNRQAKIRMDSMKREILINHHRETRDLIRFQRKTHFKSKYQEKVNRAEFRRKVKEIQNTAKTWLVALQVFSMNYLIKQTLQIGIKIKNKQTYNIRVFKQIIKAIGKFKRKIWIIRFRKLVTTMKKLSPQIYRFNRWIQRKRAQKITREIQSIFYNQGMHSLMTEFINNIKYIQRVYRDCRAIKKYRIVSLNFHWKKIQQESFTLQHRAVRLRNLMNIMKNQFEQIKQKAINRYIRNRIKFYYQEINHYRQKKIAANIEKRFSYLQRTGESILNNVQTYFKIKQPEKPCLVVFNDLEGMKDLISRAYIDFHKSIERKKTTRKTVKVIERIKQETPLTHEQVLKIAFGPLLKKLFLNPYIY